jgi:hypothetical protein
VRAASVEELKDGLRGLAGAARARVARGGHRRRRR